MQRKQASDCHPEVRRCSDQCVHGFNNHTPPRCDKAAADPAWRRTIAFCNRNLRG